MTHEELVAHVAGIISGAPFPSNRSVQKARAILSEVYKALEEPSEEMRRVVAANWGHRMWREFGEVLRASPLATKEGE